MALTEPRAAASGFYNCITYFQAGTDLMRTTYFHGKMIYFLGIDVSTTASKAVAIDNKGNVIATHSEFHESFSVPSQPLWSEQNPDNWWHATLTAIQSVLKKIPAHKIKSIALTGQMHGLVLLDHQKKPLRKAILWNDQRSSQECEMIDAELGSAFLCQHIGSKILPCQLLPKLNWVKKHEPHIYRKIAHIITPKDYVRYCLSGVLAVDESDAAGFAMMDVKKRIWSSPILNNQNIPAHWLPPIYHSSAICAHVDAKSAEKTGLIVGTPMVAGAGDQPAQSIGCGMVEAGAMSLQIGTSGVVTQIGQYAPAHDGSFLDYCHAQPNQWIAMGLTAAAAGSFRWFRDHIAKKFSFKELDDMAICILPGADGLLFIPDICGNIHPYGDATARGHFIGLTERHTLAHMARAVLEGVAFSLKEIADMMCALSGFYPDNFLISGGAANSALWKTIFANVMQKPLYTVNSNEGAAYGAAIIAGVSIGFWSDLKTACNAFIQKTESIESIAEEKNEYERLYPIWKTIYPQVKNIRALA